MKKIVCLLLVVLMVSSGFSQQVYSAKKGPKFMPGHLHTVVEIENDSLRYQLFNHWYASSYKQLRDVRVAVNQLNTFNSDTLSIYILENSVKLMDKEYKIKGAVKNQKLCASLDEMRKIAFAYSLTERQKGLRHFDLYTQEDLRLPEVQFKIRVEANFKKRK